MSPDGGAPGSQGLSTIAAVQDYAGAWTAERGRCHRLVHGSEDGRPTHRQEPPARSGWRQDGQGRWYAVDACERNSSQLVSRGGNRTLLEPL
jgi:hypothetical protein